MAINSLSSLNMMSMNRIGGLQSGMDTDSIVKNLMKVQQAKYDKMMQAKTRAEWKKTAYTDINNALRKFQDEYARFSSATSKYNMLAAGTYKNYTVDMPQNVSLSATATTTAREGTYTVTIEQLAKGAMLTGTAASANGNGFSSSVVENTQIGNISSFASGQTVSGGIRFTVNGKEFAFQSTDTLKKVMDTVNASDAGVTMSYSQITDKFVFETKAVGEYSEGMTAPTAPPPFSFDYAGAGGTLIMPDFMDEPGEGAMQEELEAYALYQQQVSDYQADYNARYQAASAAYQTEMTQYNRDLAAYNQNESYTLNMTDTTGFLSAIGLGSGATASASQMAKLTVNGTQITRDSNNFELDGVNFKLTQETTAAISFTVRQDVQPSVDAVKSFVKAYNDLVTALYGKLTEKKYYNYAPLSDEQRSALSDTEAALWDERAKSGLLRSDSTLQTLTNSVQKAFSSAIGDMGTLSSIGITGAGYRVGQPNLIQLDEDKLRAALEADPDKVRKMFTETVNDASGKLDFSKSGLMQRLNAAINTFADTTSYVSIKSLNDSISSWESKLQAEITRLYNIQEAYYKKYAAMETALAKMQSQTDALSSMGYSN